MGCMETIQRLLILCITYPYLQIITCIYPVTYIISTGRLTKNGQRWVNKIAEFFFSLHYKPGKQNTVADTLSRTSEQTHLEDIQSCTETVPVEMVKPLLDRSNLTQEKQEPVAVCLNTAIKEQTNILDYLTTANKCFTIDGIKKGQRVEYWISRVKEILKQPARLSLGIEEANQKKFNNCYSKKQSCLLVMVLSYFVKIRSNAKSSYRMLLKKQFTKSCISTWLIFVQIELYCSSGKGFTDQK